MEFKLDVPDLEDLEAQDQQAEAVVEALPEPAEPAPAAAVEPTEVTSGATTGYQTPGWLKPFRKPPEGSDEERGFLGTMMDALAAPSAGLNDYVVDEMNKLPFINMRKRSKFDNEAIQATRELSSILIPFVAMRRAGMKAGGAMQAKINHPLGNRRSVKFLSEMGIDAGVGAYVDYTNSINQFDDNLGGWLQKNWPKTWAFLPSDWVTLDSDSPDLKRTKNIMEGMRFGLFSSVLEASVKLFRAIHGTRRITSYTFENDSVAKKFAKQEFDDGDGMDVLNSLEASAQKHENAIVEQGDLALSKNPNPDTPTIGVHDSFDDVQAASRSVDDMGIIGASVDAVRIQENAGTVYGRLGNMASEGVLKHGLEGESFAQREIVNALIKEVRDTGKYSATLTDGTKYSMDKIDEAGAKLAEAFIDPRMEPGSLRALLNGFSDEYTKLGKTARAVDDVGYNAAEKAVKKLLDNYLNMDAVKAQAYFTSSIAGQVSDIAEGARYADEAAAIDRAKDRIFDRLQYLLAEKNFANKLKGQSQNTLDVMQRSRKNPEVLREAAEAANQNADEAYQESVRKAVEFREALEEVNEKMPEFTNVLLEAYELSDGNIDTMSKLNNYIYEKLGAINKFIWDEQPEIPNDIVQGIRSNLYNSVLTSTTAPASAILGNSVMLLQKPVAVFAGAVMGGDIATIRRGWHMYSAVGESFGRSLKYAGKVFMKASKDPSAVANVGRQDLVYKNQQSLQLTKSYADAAAARGEEGPLAMYYLQETLMNLGDNPLLRLGANIMTGMDGFTHAMNANARARFLGYEEFAKSGRTMTPEDLKKFENNVYSEFFDSQGMLIEQSSKFDTQEMALNLDSDGVRAFSNLLNKNPWMKMFILFPRTQASVISVFGQHSPITAFIGDYKKLVLPYGYADMTQQEIEAVLKPRGLKGTKAELDHIRADMRGRMAIGTGAVFLAYNLWQQGRLRGDGHFDKGRQRTRNNLGWKAGTVQTDDGTWVDFSWLGPMGDWIKMTANVMDNFVDTVEPTSVENFLQKMAFIIGASLTERSMYANMEPMFDVLRGDGAAINRWAANYTSSLAPLSAARKQIGDIMSPGLKEMDNEYGQMLLNRNKFMPAAQEMPDAYDWFEPQRVGYPENPFVRVWNATMPMKIYDGNISPERQFLLDIEFDTRPTFSKGANGIDYTADERAEMYRLMGESGYFKSKVTEIMKSKPYKDWKESMMLLRSEGKKIDETQYWNLYNDLDSALLEAKNLVVDTLINPEMRADIRAREFQAAKNIELQRQGKAPIYDVDATNMTNR